MSGIELTPASNKKWLVLGAVAALGAGLIWYAVGRDDESGRVQAASEPGSASAQASAAAASEVPPFLPASSPEVAAVMSGQADAAKAVERQTVIKPIEGPVSERPEYVSLVEWAMLKSVAQQNPAPDQELTRLVNSLRFMKLLELWQDMPRAPETALRRQSVAAQLIDELPGRVRNAETDVKDAQAMLPKLLADAISDASARKKREAIESKHLSEAGAAAAATASAAGQ
jgi:hypothetical protein